MGCRNPWRINVDQRTGYLYWGDVGPDAGGNNARGPRGYDEFNQARAAGNFGWPYFIGNNFAYSMVNFVTGEISPAQDPEHPINHSVNNSGSKTLPRANPAMVYYPSATSEEFPQLASGGRTACAGPVYYFDPKSSSSVKFPEHYDRTWFAFEWSRNAIYAIHLDESSNMKSIERFLPEQTFVRPIDMLFDPQGSLYVIEYGETWGVNPDAKLVRVDYVRGNRKPTAIAKAENTVGREPLRVHLRGNASFDRDGDMLTYQWNAVSTVQGETQRKVLGTKAELETIFETPGIVTVELEVRDSNGVRDVTSFPVIVGNSPPNVEFIRPASGDFFSPGETLRYEVVVRDQEDGTSDVDQAEEEGWHFIDPTAPSRLFVEAVPIKEQASQSEDANPGLQLIRKSDCLNCHAANRPLVGPSFVDIANKYRNQPHQLEQSVTRVIQGSTGVWGKVGMLPHQQHTPAEVRSMVEYVYSVTAAAANPSAPGFTNDLTIPKGAQQVRFEATYSDAGRGEIPKLIGTGSVLLRNRHIQAEAADEFAGTRVLNSSKAEGKKFMGAIEHNGFLKFNLVSLDQFDKVQVRVASAGSGGSIEIRKDRIDGPLLGSTTVEVNGDWEAFYEKTIEVEKSTGRSDLYVVFKNEKKPGGLMNIDSLEFARVP